MTTQDIEFEKRGHSYGVIHLRAPKDGTLMDLVAFFIDHFQVKARADELLQLGAIYLENQRQTDPSLGVRQGQYLRLHTQPRRFQKPLENMKDCVLHQEDGFYVVNKPAGISTHASVDNLHENLHAWLEKDLAESLYLTSRLDVPTHGLLIYARTKDFQSYFNRCLNEKSVRKEYRAAHEGAPLATGVYEHWMQISPRAPKILWATKPSHEPSQQCLLEILRSEQSKDQNHCISQIQLFTGRTHQIRAQLSQMGRPILGDTLYHGKKKSCWDTNRISLFCHRLQFQNYDFQLPEKELRCLDRDQEQ